MAGQLWAHPCIISALKLANSVVMHMHAPTPDPSHERSLVLIAKSYGKSL